MPESHLPSAALRAFRAFRALESDLPGVVALRTLAGMIRSGRDEAHNWPIPPGMVDDCLFVLALAANVPGQGEGRQLLTELCRVCDAEGVALLLDAKKYGEGLEQASLVAFYERFGFVPFEDLTDYLDTPMVRLPKQ